MDAPLKLTNGWAMPSKEADALILRCQKAESDLEDARTDLAVLKAGVRDAMRLLGIHVEHTRGMA